MANLFSAALPFLADALVILGVFVMTIGVYGVARMPDTYTKLHATSKAVFLGVISLCLSSASTGDPQIIYRVILIAAFLIITTPISAFVIARAAMLRGERMETPAPSTSRAGACRGRRAHRSVSPPLVVPRRSRIQPGLDGEENHPARTATPIPGSMTPGDRRSSTRAPFGGRRVPGSGPVPTLRTVSEAPFYALR